MQQLLQNKRFICEIAALKANFFQQMVEFCIKELENRIKPIHNDNELQDELIYKQIESLDDPYLQSLFIETDNEGEPEDKQQQKKESDSNRAKKDKSHIKPYFLAFKPKAPTTSYLLFLHENKGDIAARHKITNISQVTKLASEQWKKLPESQRQKYYKKAQSDKARYKEAMNDFNQRFAEQIKAEKKRRQSAYKTRWMEKKRKLGYQSKQSPKICCSSQNEKESISHSQNQDNQSLQHDNEKVQNKRLKQEQNRKDDYSQQEYSI